MISNRTLFRAVVLLTLVSVVAPQLLGSILGLLAALIDALLKDWNDLTKHPLVSLSSITQNAIKNLGKQPSYSSGTTAATTTTTTTTTTEFTTPTVSTPSLPPTDPQTTTTTTTTTTTKATTPSYDQQYPITLRTDIRLMTKAQWNKVAAAIARLMIDKPDSSKPESWMDTFAGIHRSANAPAAHGGPGFIAWHSIYMHSFVNALKKIDPEADLPIYDSRPCTEIPSHCDSFIFTEEFLGNCQGVVTIGPFKNRQVYPSDCASPSAAGPLLNRTCNSDYKSLLYDYAEFASVVSGYRSYSDFVRPFTNTYEDNHGGLHVAIGGHLNVLSCASNDPFFYMIHGMIHAMFDIAMDVRFSLQDQVNMQYPSRIDIKPEHRGTALAIPYDITLQDCLKQSMQRNMRYNIVPDNCDKDSDCNFTNSDINGLWCKTSNRRCASKIRIGGRCKDSSGTIFPNKACYREPDCTQDPTCNGNVCVCQTNSGVVRSTPRAA